MEESEVEEEAATVVVTEEEEEEEKESICPVSEGRREQERRSTVCREVQRRNSVRQSSVTFTQPEIHTNTLKYCSTTTQKYFGEGLVNRQEVLQYYTVT